MSKQIINVAANILFVFVMFPLLIVSTVVVVFMHEISNRNFWKEFKDEFIK